MITARRVFLILVIIILIIWAVVVFIISVDLLIYIILALTLLVALYLLFKEDRKITNKPNDPANPNYNNRLKNKDSLSDKTNNK